MIGMGLATCSTDIYIASLPNMVQVFDSTPEMLQFTITAAILGSSISTLFVGPLSDSIGRRRLLVGGQFLFAFFTLLSAFSPSAEFLVACRFLGGFVSCTTFVLVFAVISDLYKSDEAAVQYANLTTCILVSLILAPLVGGYFAEIKRWDLSFLSLGSALLLSAISFWLFLPETQKEKKQFSLKEASKTYGKILSNMQFLPLSLIPALLIGGILSFFTNGSFYYINELGLSEWQYTMHQVLIMGSNCLFSFLAGRFIKRYGVESISKLGIKVALLGGTGFFISSLLYSTSPLVMTITMTIFASGVGFGFSSITAMAMNLISESSGIASALLTLIRSIFIGISITFASFLYTNKAIEIGYMVVLTCLSSLSLYLIYHYKTKRLKAPVF